MSVSPFRETQVLLELAGFRFLTQAAIDEFLFGESARVATSVIEAQHDSEWIGKGTPFAFTTLEELLGASGPFGPIWQFGGRSGREPMIQPVEDGEAS